MDACSIMYTLNYTVNNFYLYFSWVNRLEHCLQIYGRRKVNADLFGVLKCAYKFLTSYIHIFY